MITALALVAAFTTPAHAATPMTIHVTGECKAYVDDPSAYDPTVLATELGKVEAQCRADKGLPLPAMGATVAISDCGTRIVAAPWNVRRAGQLVIDEAKAQEICLRAKGNFAIAEAQAKAIGTRATAEASLITDAGAAAKAGGSVRYHTDGQTVDLSTGGAAEWQAYGEAVSNGTGYTGAVYDPRFAQPFALDQARAGFMGAPAIPGGATVTQPVADASALGTCQRALRTTAAQLQSCTGGN